MVNGPLPPIKDVLMKDCGEAGKAKLGTIASRPWNSAKCRDRTCSLKF
jgi:hypothetical protein